MTPGKTVTNRPTDTALHFPASMYGEQAPTRRKMKAEAKKWGRRLCRTSSHIVLRHFQMGPIEWVWRRVTYASGTPQIEPNRQP